MTFEVVTALVALLAGGIASIAGFGIGSLLTPLLAQELGMKSAVAAVSVPHLFGTTLRLWMLRKSVDRRVLLSFGMTSAAGGLAGALLQAYTVNRHLNLLLAVLLILAGGMGVFGLSERIRFGRIGAWTAGAISGALGGLVGNQGGIRSAAMLGFDVPRDAFVATATAIALMVDGARMPVYLYTQANAMERAWGLIALSTAGVLIGTALGELVLRRIPEAAFKRTVSGIILALGLALLFKGV
jgi:uncharacterized membrane protein YfcA